MSVMVGPSLPPCRDEGVPVHHDPVHGIVANPGNREWEPFPLSFFAVCDNPVHRVMVNWDPTISQVIDLLGPFQKGNASMCKHSRHASAGPLAWRARGGSPAFALPTLSTFILLTATASLLASSANARSHFTTTRVKPTTTVLGLMLGLTPL